MAERTRPGATTGLRHLRTPATGVLAQEAHRPRATASAAWSWPSVVAPGRQQKRSPGATRRLSWAIPRTSAAEGSPVVTTTSTSSSNRFICTGCG